MTTVLTLSAYILCLNGLLLFTMHPLIFQTIIKDSASNPNDLIKLYNESKYATLSCQSFSPSSFGLKDLRFPTESHSASVNSLDIEYQSNRFLLSGGSESSIKIWDLDETTDNYNDELKRFEYKPIAVVPPKSVHRFGITKVKWWSVDNEMFLSSSYDHRLTFFSTEKLEPVHSFNLESRISDFDIHPNGNNSLVACCCDGGYGGVTLVDLRILSKSHTLGGGSGGSGASGGSHSYAEYYGGRGGNFANKSYNSTTSVSTSNSNIKESGIGSTLCCSFSPNDPNLLVTGTYSGCCYGFDIRKSNSCVFTLNSNLTISNFKNKSGKYLSSSSPTFSTSSSLLNPSDSYSTLYKNSTIHSGGVNSVIFNDNGTELITLGLDERIQVWDLTTSTNPLNKLTNFGPLIRNKNKTVKQISLSPSNETELQYLCFPSDNGELLMFRLVDGKLVSRISDASNSLNADDNLNCVVYQGGSSIKYYTGDTGGSIKIWGPKNNNLREEMELKGLETEDFNGDEGDVDLLELFDNGIDYSNSKEAGSELETKKEKHKDILDRIQDEIDANEIRRKNGMI